MRFAHWLRAVAASKARLSEFRWRPRRCWFGLERLEERCVLASPVVSVLPISPQEGLTFNGVVANVIDPGNNEPASDYSALINWGDGGGTSPAPLSGSTGGPFTITASHTYAADGQLGLTISVTNNLLNQTGRGATPIVVIDQAPVVSALAITPQQGIPFNGAVATFTDPGGAEPAANYSATINWGDGNGSVTGSSSIGYNAGTGVFTVYGSHLYAAAGSDPITVTVTDSGGVAGANTWTTVAPMPTATSEPAAATGANGMIYVFGGYNGGLLKTVQGYNPATNTWTTEAPMPTATDGSAASGSNGLLYVFGGYNGTSLDTVQAYNPVTNTWTTEAPMPTGGVGMGVATGANGLIYVFGGTNNGNSLNTVQVYNPATNTWTTLSPMPTAVSGPATVAGDNGLLYVFGGDDNGNILNTAESYNPTSNTWTNVAPMLSYENIVTATAAPNGLLYVFGFYQSVQAYNPATNSWTLPAAVPTVTTAPAASTGPNGLIYLFGGQTLGGTPLATAQMYRTAGMSGLGTSTASVAGPPVVTAPSNQMAIQSTAMTFTLGSFTDPVSAASPWQVTVNWGDGYGISILNVNSVGTLGSLSHTYTAYGTDTVTETVTASDGASGSSSFTIAVASEAPVVSVPLLVPRAGLPFNGVVANVLDPGNNEPVSDYSALITWGDGSGTSTAALSGPTGGPFTVSGTHTYLTETQYTLTVAVTNTLVNKIGSGQATVAVLPQGYTPEQIRQAYGFNSIGFGNGVVGDGTMAKPLPLWLPTSNPISRRTCTPSISSSVCRTLR